MNVYDPNAFRNRVEFAAAHISAGRGDSRAFDTCFEMYDGDAVAAALIRRIDANPNSMLARNIFRYIGEDLAREASRRLGDDLDLEAKIMREAASKFTGICIGN